MAEKLGAIRTKTRFFMTSPRKSFIPYEGDYNGGLRFNRSFFDKTIRVSTHRKGPPRNAAPAVEFRECPTLSRLLIGSLLEETTKRISM
jgi:hypothetical protein